MPEKIKFYTDEHVSTAVANGLRLRGADVLTVVEAGMLGATDEEHLQLAKDQERVVFTQDRDFLRLHAQGIEHAGIAFAAQPMPIGQIIAGLMLIHQVLAPNEMRNRVEFL